MEKRFVWAIRKKNWLFLPVAFLLAVMPVVIRATQHFLSGDLYRLFLTGQKTELFSQYRARFLWIMAAVMLILVLVFWKKLFSGLDRLGWFYFAPFFCCVWFFPHFCPIIRIQRCGECTTGQKE